MTRRYGVMETVTYFHPDQPERRRTTGAQSAQMKIRQGFTVEDAEGNEIEAEGDDDEEDAVANSEVNQSSEGTPPPPPPPAGEAGTESDSTEEV